MKEAISDILRWLINSSVLITYIILALTLLCFPYYSNKENFIFSLQWCITLALSLTIIHRKKIASVQKLCKGKSHVVDCNLILDSSKANALPHVTWADFGAIYAFSAIALLALSSRDVGFIPLYLSLPAAIYSIYSIYYQLFRAKIVCTLCMLVQITILGGLAVCLFQGKTSEAVGYLIYALPVTFIVSTGIHFAFSYHSCKRETITDHEGLIYKQIKASDHFFHQLTTLASRIEVPPSEAIIRLNSWAGAPQLTLVVNPGCPKCIGELRALLQRLAEGELELNVSLIWPTDQPNYLETLETIWETRADNALLLKTLIKLSSSYPSSLNSLKARRGSISFKVSNELAVDWALRNQVHETPLLIYRGVRLPYYYSVDDLLRLIDG